MGSRSRSCINLNSWYWVCGRWCNRWYRSCIGWNSWVKVWNDVLCLCVWCIPDHLSVSSQYPVFCLDFIRLWTNLSRQTPVDHWLLGSSGTEQMQTGCPITSSGNCLVPRSQYCWQLDVCALTDFAHRETPVAATVRRLLVNVYECAVTSVIGPGCWQHPLSASSAIQVSQAKHLCCQLCISSAVT